ncbi:MAG: SUMF1/EgtB/PvdO family nonheme iron enzyme, partial [Anaerolineae bacterium]|jgi:formylglycine-generating enzyme required for sulfatase activity
MVYVPAGVFWMGSDDTPYTEERPAHEVSVDAFWIDQTEVTVAQYVRCVDAGACKPPVLPGSFARETYYGESAYGQYPVVHVNWYRAVSYCSWAGGRLPAEAEWAYAARGPESRHYPWGDVPDATRLNYCDVNCDLSHADPAGDDGYADTAPVGSYPAGASWVGAFDLLGNAWEWVWDWFDYYPSPERPGWMAPAMTHRVIRGGGWDTVPDHARNAYRGWYEPAAAQDSIGFRCAFSVAGE